MDAATPSSADGLAAGFHATRGGNRLGRLVSKRLARFIPDFPQRTAVTSIRVKRELKLCDRRRGSGELRGRGSVRIPLCSRSHFDVRQIAPEKSGTSAEDLRLPGTGKEVDPVCLVLAATRPPKPWNVNRRLRESRQCGAPGMTHTHRGAFALIAAHPRAALRGNHGGSWPSCAWRRERAWRRDDPQPSEEGANQARGAQSHPCGLRSLATAVGAVTVRARQPDRR